MTGYPAAWFQSTWIVAQVRIRPCRSVLSHSAQEVGLSAVRTEFFFSSSDYPEAISYNAVIIGFGRHLTTLIYATLKS
jgi:hypothetical protein